MKPFVKWAGGKEKEIKFFEGQFPSVINNYYEPFLGGGSVFFYVNDKYEIINSYINDFSKELIELYRLVKIHDENFFLALYEIEKDLVIIKDFCQEDFSKLIIEKLKNLFEKNNEISNLYFDNINFNFCFNNEFIDKSKFNDISNSIMKSKLKRLKKIQTKNNDSFLFEPYSFLETVLKSAYYTYIRNLYNSNIKNESFGARHIAYFYYLREYCYSSMFRYNLSGEFNVPYGGMAYNDKYFNHKIEQLESRKLNKLLLKSKIYNMDFEKFIKTQKFDKNDFIFVDPPYDSEFSEYDKNAFSRDDQTRLAICLSELKCKVMVVIKNTNFIEDLYLKLGFKIQAFDKKYSVNFMNRNIRDVEHLIITNY